MKKNFSREIKSNGREVVVGNSGAFPEAAEKRAARWFFKGIKQQKQRSMRGKDMIFVNYDILSFGYYVICMVSELIGYRKKKKPSICNRCGVAYEADRSRHPE